MKLVSCVCLVWLGWSGWTCLLSFLSRGNQKHPHLNVETMADTPNPPNPTDATDTFQDSTPTIRLHIPRLEHEDVYTIPTNIGHLSPVLDVLISDTFTEEGNEEEPTIGPCGLDITLPVKFQDSYMKMVEFYLNIFSSTPIPTIRIPLPGSTSAQDVIHSDIYRKLNAMAIQELPEFRNVCMFFELNGLIDSIDVLLAYKIRSNPKTTFSAMHDENMTLAGSSIVVQAFPFLK